MNASLSGLDSDTRKYFNMFPSLFNVYFDIVSKEVKMRMERTGVKFHGNEKTTCW